jgi:membrane protein DedA with SNARE-associated domain
VVPVASLTSFVGDHSVYAVFGLMAVAAVFPAGSELVMIYAGALVASGHVVLFGHHLASGAGAYVAVVIAGVLGNVLGAAAGWAIGAYGGRPLLERHGRWLHVTPAKLDRAERLLERYELAAVPVGFAAPGLRSFVAIPAGIVRLPPARFLVLATAGITAFCFGLAGGGWALGSSYDRLHHDLRYAYVGIAVAVVAGLAYWAVRRRRSSRLAARAEDPAH